LTAVSDNQRKDSDKRSHWVFAVLVAGPSMVPALRHGDALLVRRTTSGRPGAVAVVRFGTDPTLYVKRLVRPCNGGWWALGDNAVASSDSRTYGPAQVVGRVLFRWWPYPSRVGSGGLPGDEHADA
jgi:phage repressor protein C with HTH and peptisase S24 domain